MDAVGWDRRAMVLGLRPAPRNALRLTRGRAPPACGGGLVRDHGDKLCYLPELTEAPNQPPPPPHTVFAGRGRLHAPRPRCPSATNAAESNRSPHVPPSPRPPPKAPHLARRRWPCPARRRQKQRRELDRWLMEPRERREVRTCSHTQHRDGKACRP